MSAGPTMPTVTTAERPRRLAFDLPAHLEAAEPPEARGLTRDGVRMLVAERATGRLAHTTFGAIPSFLQAGDLVVINTSAVVPAAITARGDDGAALVVHLSTRLDDGLWVAELHLPQPVFTWLAVHGQPIRYGYVDRPWPIASYQNVYATEPGSAEMPSAGRPFTPEVITRLVAKGVGVSPLVLHTGVASLEATELPYPERLRVRALETAGGNDGIVHAVDGWTDLVITPQRGVCVVDGLLTGWHEPQASHLLMLEALAGRSLLEASYEASLEEGYLWHEFGDTHLILP